MGHLVILSKIRFQPNLTHFFCKYSFMYIHYCQTKWIEVQVQQHVGPDLNPYSSIFRIGKRQLLFILFQKFLRALYFISTYNNLVTSPDLTTRWSVSPRPRSGLDKALAHYTLSPWQPDKNAGSQRNIFPVTDFIAFDIVIINA